MQCSFERAILALFALIARLEKKRGFARFPLIPLLPLLLLSALFGRLASWRLALYTRGILQVKRLDVLVISIGNLCSGGSGKTPMVGHLARRLSALNPAILSRGYRSRFFRSSALINDALGPLYPVQFCGDEPYLLALHTSAPVVIDSDRVRGAEFALKQLQPQALLLDDGFQHRRLARQCDILLIEASQIATEPRCFPAGSQRNRLKDCSYADLVIITGSESDRKWREKADIVEKLTRARIVGARYDLISLIPLEIWKGGGYGVDALDGEFEKALPELGPVFVCSALANPERFHKTLKRAGLRLVGSCDLPDHTPFDRKKAASALRRALALEAKALICTEKDAVKWSAESSRLPIYVARSEWRIVENEAVWTAFLNVVESSVVDKCPEKGDLKKGFTFL